MKESSWEDCLESNSAIGRTEDRGKAMSLIKVSRGRIDFLEKQTLELDESNANYVFENYYTSITEIIHALALVNGFKILNHICLGFFLRDSLKKEEFFRIFDDQRFKRNGLVYYGNMMDLETAKDSIKSARLLVEALIKVFKNGENL